MNKPDQSHLPSDSKGANPREYARNTGLKAGDSHQFAPVRPAPGRKPDAQPDANRTHGAPAGSRLLIHARDDRHRRSARRERREPLHRVDAVNLAEVADVWRCLTRRPIPDFTHGLGTI